MLRSPEAGMLQAQVGAWLEKNPASDAVLAFRCAPGWDGGPQLSVGSTVFSVREARSPLEVREVLAAAERGGERLVLLTPLDTGVLGADVLARLSGQRLRVFDAWEAVRAAFRARDVDVLLLKEDRLAHYLLEAQALARAVPLPGGVLTAEIAWQLLLTHFLGEAAGRIADLRGLLRWCADGEAGRLAAMPDDLRGSAMERLRRVGGPAATPVLSCIARGNSDSVLPMGLACLALFGADPDAEDATVASAGRVRLERFTGGVPVLPDQGLAWGRATAEVVLEDVRPADPAAARSLLDEGDRMLRELGSDACAHHSRLSILGLEQRLARFGEALRRALDDAGRLPTLESAADAVAAHAAADLDPARVRRVRMALRLVRWLSRSDDRSPGLAAQASLHIADSAFADRARRHLVGGEGLQSLGMAFSRLLDRVHERRERENAAFGSALGAWHESGGGGVLGVEDVLDRVVAPLAKQARVLLVVLDGMGWSVCSELVEDLAAHGWIPLAPQDGSGLAPVVAAVPSVTETSRMSLLAGRPARGDARAEREAFSSHAVLRSAGRADTPPYLVHRAELDEAWDGTVLSRIESDRYRVVGVVVNAVDDHLARDGQLSYPWTLDTIRPLRPLLEAAARAGRVVVLASDHGHVLELGTTARGGEGGERWRAATEPAQDGEVQLEGPRVLLPGGAPVVLPWSERIRYGPKKWGYHGGATPQEMLTPLVVLGLPGRAVAGWRPVPLARPAWWEGADISLVRDERPTRPARPSKKRKLEQMVLPDTSEPDWVDRLQRAPAMQEAVARAGLDDESRLELRRLLSALKASDGRLSRSLAGQVVGRVEPDLQDFLQRVERVLNVEGFAVLTSGIGGETIVLNLDLVERHFLGGRGRSRSVRVETPQGETVSFTVPFDLTDHERSALEALGRFGRLTEPELTQRTGTRRIGSILQNLMARLDQAGWQALRDEPAGDAGRLYLLDREKLPREAEA